MTLTVSSTGSDSAVDVSEVTPSKVHGKIITPLFLLSSIYKLQIGRPHVP